MDARTAESPVTLQQESWLRRERASGRFYDRLMVLLGLVLIAILALSGWLLSRSAEPGTLLSPPLIAMLLIAILLPAIALMALYARKVAVRRAEQGGLGSGRLHVRLVALFTAIAAVPTVLVAIFASVLFQSGLEFWFSNRARNMLENTVQVAQGVYRYELSQIGAQATTMAGDLTSYLQKVPMDDPQFQTGLAFQTYQRALNEAAILKVGPGVLEGHDPGERDVEAKVEALAGELGRAGEAVEDAGDAALLDRAIEDFGRVLLRVAGVDDQRKARLASCVDMRLEALALRCAVGLIVIIIEPALADGDDPRMIG
jgi:two-component system nitrogen regulation sensor histidine kinase NtrY